MRVLSFRILFFVVPICWILLCSEMSPSQFGRGSLKVFPGAEGFGTYTAAGRGGQIIRVTNLNDNGPGSLRAAVQVSVPRIIVFDVGGAIDLQSSIVITNPHITIAGQSAPAPGITLTGYGLQLQTHDVLIQHLFIRITSSDGGDSLQVNRGGHNMPLIYNVVIDHVSMAWANDENASVVWGAGHDFTYSNCLLGEGHYGMLIDFGVKNISILRNLVMSATQRHPRIKGGVSGIVVNNVFYNCGNQCFAQIGSSHGRNYISFAGNTFIDGPFTKSESFGVQVYNAVSGSQLFVPVFGWYRNTATRNVYSSEVFPFLVDASPRTASLAGITIIPTGKIENFIYNNAGARPAERNTQNGDSIDRRFIFELKNRSGRFSNHGKPSWKKPVSTKRLFDVGPNPSGDDNKDGYTNIEEILYQMALVVEGRTNMNQ